ncbi:membrane protein, partial [Candidatus Magnetomorum sp. HK-1]
SEFSSSLFDQFLISVTHSFQFLVFVGFLSVTGGVKVQPLPSRTWMYFRSLTVGLATQFSSFLKNIVLQTLNR